MDEQSIFLRAIEKEPGDERKAFLDEVCDGDASLRAGVEALLAAYESPDSFLACPYAERAERADLGETSMSPSEVPGSVIGPYTIREQIGEGGMGLVYVAEQTQPVRRKVALKVIKPGMDSRQVVARFEAERQALAMMDHPNIARVFDGGATEAGRPYFVMELVKGVPITEYCDEHRLPLRERLELFLQVSAAVQHAHQKGIIHRDIKPSNVLVVSHDGVPVAKVIDFGIAKAMGQQLTDKTIYTHFVQFVGTPAYMSPEQAGQSGLDIDTRTDVYALGVLLYELLTGTTPFDKDRLKDASYEEIRRIIRDEDPPRMSARVSTLNQNVGSTISAQRRIEPKQLSLQLRGELDWIVMKALEKDRTRRYESASALGADVARSLHDEQVEACPPTLGYRAQKFVRRHKALIAVCVTVAMLLLIGIATTSWQAKRAIKAESDAKIQEDLANTQRWISEEREHELWRQAYPANIQAAHRALKVGDVKLAREILAIYESSEGREDLRGFEWYYLRNLCAIERVGEFKFRAHENIVFHVTFSPDSARFATCSADQTARIWDARSRKVLWTLQGHGDDVNCAKFTRDGKVLVTASDDGTIRTWNVDNGNQISVVAHTIGQNPVDTASPRRVEIADVALSHDEKTLAAACWDGSIRLYDFPSGDERRALAAHRGKAESVAFTADGRFLITAGRDGIVKAWDCETWDVRTTYQSNGAEVKSIATAHGLPLVAIADYAGRIAVWNFIIDQVRLTFAGAPMQRVAFSPDDKALSVCDFRGGVWKIDVATEKLISFRLGDQTRAWSVAFSPNGAVLAVSNEDGTVVMMPQPKNLPWVELAGSVAFDPNGNRLVTALGNSIQIWDAHERGVQLDSMTLPSSQKALILSLDGKILIAREGNDTLRIWDVSTKKSSSAVLVSSDLQERLQVVSGVDHFCVCQAQSKVRVCDMATGTEVQTLPGSEFDNGFIWVSPNGKLFGNAFDGQLRIRDRQSRRLLAELSIGSRAAVAAAFCWQGVKHATGGQEGSVFIDDLVTGKRIGPMHGHQAKVTSLAFSPDGKTLASTSWDGTIRLWQVATGRELLTLEGHRGRVQYAAFSNDSRMLVTRGCDNEDQGDVFLWNARDRVGHFSP